MAIELINTIPVWALAIAIFLLRMLDVSMGTIRMIAIVEGRIPIAVVLGFLEISVWVVAISQVITNITDSPWLVLAYAGGFATGNALGMTIEKKVAIGTCVLRIIANEGGKEIAKLLRDQGQIVTTFNGEGRDSPVILIFALMPRKKVHEMVVLSQSVNPNLFYSVERANDWRRRPGHSTKWHNVTKKK